MDLADLEDLLGRLDDMQTDAAAGTETIDELRGRIEILMDEIDISLGIEPAPIAGLADLDAEPFGGRPGRHDGEPARRMNARQVQAGIDVRPGDEFDPLAQPPEGLRRWCPGPGVPVLVDADGSACRRRERIGRAPCDNQVWYPLRV
jgi:hypothetical protein